MSGAEDMLEVQAWCMAVAGIRHSVPLQRIPEDFIKVLLLI